VCRHDKKDIDTRELNVGLRITQHHQITSIGEVDQYYLLGRHDKPRWQLPVSPRVWRRGRSQEAHDRPRLVAGFSRPANSSPRSSCRAPVPRTASLLRLRGCRRRRRHHTCHRPPAVFCIRIVRRELLDAGSRCTEV
jgi:hypothetical protein